LAETDLTNEDTRRRSLNHFGVWALADEYWRLATPDRAALRKRWIAAFDRIATASHHYRAFPIEARGSIITWTAVDATDPAAPQHFFDRFAEATRPFHPYVRLVDALWGFTRPSEYSRARSRGEIDPFAGRTMPYLIMYPFTKTAEWYLLDGETRQSLMNEHIRIGKQYREITQLLLYSTGLQDQEFVVVYETADLPMFSRLVTELRATESRRYTKVDTPVHTAVHRPAELPDELWP